MSRVSSWHVDLRLPHHVDESRCHDETRDIERLAGLGAVQEADAPHPVPGDRLTPPVARVAAAVHDPAAPEEHVVATRSPSPFPVAAPNQEQEHSQDRPYFAHVFLNESGWIKRPRSITQAIRRVARMPLSGSPSSTTRSATFPASSRPATSRTLAALVGTSSIPGRSSSVGLSSRASISCSTSVGTTATCVATSARATRATAVESSDAHPLSSSVHPARKRSCALKY